MTTFKIAVQIGAAITGGFTSAVRGSTAQLNQLGSSLDSLKQKQASIKKVELGEASVGKARVAYNAAVRDVVRLRREMAQTNEPSKQLAASFETAKQKASRLSTALGQQRERLQRAKQALKQTGLSTDNLAEDNRQLGRSVEKLNRQYTRLGQSIRAQQALQGKRSELRGQLFDAVAIGATVAAPLKIAIDFEQSVAKLGAITASDALSDEVNAQNQQALEKEARRLGKTTQFTASQSAGAMTFLGMAGFNPEQIQGATEGVLNLAQAAGADLADTADISSNILSGFALDATQDMERVGDVLTATFTTSNTTLQSLGETMKFVAPVASSAGGSIEQVAAMVGLLGDVGIQGSKAGTALRATFLRLSAPTGTAKKAIESLGVEIADIDGNLRPVPDLLKELADATADLGSTQRTGLIKQIFGEEAASGVTALLQQAGSGSLDSEIAKLEQAQGTTSAVAKKMSSTTLGSLKRLGSALESVAISVGSLLLPTLASGAELFATFASGVSTIADQFPLLTTVVVGATVGLIGLRIATIAGAFAYTFMKGTVLSLQTAYFALTSKMTLQKVAQISLNVVSRTSAVVMGLVTAAQWALNVAMTANPIGLVVVGIGALIGAGVLLVKNWDKVKTFFTSLWTGIKKLTGSAVDWLMSKIDFLMAPFKFLLKAGAVLGRAIGSAFSDDKEDADTPDSDNEVKVNHNRKRIGRVVNQTSPATELSTLNEVAVARSSAPSQSIAIDAPITIHATPGMDERAVAREVQRELNERQARSETDRRSILFDEATA